GAMGNACSAMGKPAAQCPEEAISSMGVQCEFNACGAIPCGSNGQFLQRNGQACGAMSCGSNWSTISE
ncbi:MAG TPA: hypothetical protein PKD18_23650, partial [Saprospiraceae bacterium]|nr:hypothetical protein [Saprospiraceae bacterium]